MLSRKLAAIAALSMVTASSAAVAQPAAPLSVASASSARAGESVQGAGQLEGGPALYIIGAVLLGLVLWGVISISDNADSP